ncbi:helix-turn-helix transcriptional regulator [Ochrobactrum sp. MYb379]|uniref:helix-turn-helix transcriptional regulator n=1 Tax=Ochrobactrum sp. MYb379 TaxID=2745275 RepID=UPI00309F2C41
MEIIEAAGLKILIDSMPVKSGQAWRSVMDPGIWMGAIAAGHVEVEQDQLGRRVWQKGQTAVFNSDKFVETNHCSLVSGTLSAVFIQIDPDQAESGLGSEAVSAIVSAAKNTQECGTAALDGISWQMLSCPLRGASRKLYMTGKALEFISHLVSNDSVTDGCEHARWTARDIECFHAARSILMSDLANPPTVTELARMVGTNARKLGAGFVDLFGTPVYSFVKSRRLEEARSLLESGETSISRVAHNMGYHPAHFATEFRKRFGISPTQVTGRKGFA